MSQEDLDERVITTIDGETWDLPRRFNYVQHAGSGAYGVVAFFDILRSAEEESADPELIGTPLRRVAIKKIKDCFTSAVEIKKLLREITILHHIKHPNVIELVDIIPPRSFASMNELYLCYDSMDTDLEKLLAESPSVFSATHIRYFAYQMILGVHAVHSACVWHRDLKPGNLLCKADCSMKLCDFGWARKRELELERTDYVATRWWRSPELLLRSSAYDASVDAWAVGCILYQMIARRPLLPGRDGNQMMEMCVRVLGPPTEEDLQCLPVKPECISFLREFSKPFAGTRPASIVDMIPYERRRHLSTEDLKSAESLIRGMLQWNPKKRITMRQALDHPFFNQEFKDNYFADAIIAETPNPVPDLALTPEQLKDANLLKERVYNFIRDSYHPEMPPIRPGPLPVGRGAPSLAIQLPLTALQRAQQAQQAASSSLFNDAEDVEDPGIHALEDEMTSSLTSTKGEITIGEPPLSASKRGASSASAGGSARSSVPSSSSMDESSA